MAFPLFQVDAFTDRPFAGNPAAICLLGEGPVPGDAWHQNLARELNLAETAFLRRRNGGVDEFLARLRSEHETSAVPGRFFEMPDHFRIGMGVDSEMFAEGLRRMGMALESP